MNKIHHFSANITWGLDSTVGTVDYSSYSRDHTIKSANKPVILGSSHPVFRGNALKYNPEELLVASASACHMLWYLHLCAISGVIVLQYVDDAKGSMEEEADGNGRFKEIILNPEVKVKEKAMVEKARELHDKAGQMCFIANSCNFPIIHKPVIVVENT